MPNVFSVIVQYGVFHLHATIFLFVKNQRWTSKVFLTRFRRTSDRDVIPGPEQGFDTVGGYFLADLKSFLSHSLNTHFPIFFFEDKSNVVKLGSRSAEILSLEAL
jgi:hypothetical protein